MTRPEGDHPPQESFREHVERLVSEGKLTEAEAADLLEPPAATEAARPAGMTLEKVTTGVQTFSDADTPPDLRLEVEGYSLRVVLDPALERPELRASREGEVTLTPGPAGWTVRRPSQGRGLSFGVRAVLSLPFTPRHVRAEVSGGSVSLPDLGGEAQLEISGGNASLGACAHLHAEVNGGNLSVGAVAGRLDLEVNGGNLSVAHAATLGAEVNGGNLSWTGLLSEGQHRLEVNGGQATLRLDPGSSLQLEAEATLGGLSASFPLQKTGGMMHAHYSGTLGGGEARLNCEVNAGQIRMVTS